MAARTAVVLFVSRQNRGQIGAVSVRNSWQEAKIYDQWEISKDDSNAQYYGATVRTDGLRCTKEYG